MHSISLIVFLLLGENLASAIESTNLAEESSLCAENSITDINNLGFKLLNKFVAEQGNVFLSPIGIAFSLSILYSAASNNTAKQIGRILLRDETKVTPAKVEEELNQIIESLRSVETNISTTNEIVFEDCSCINKDYVSDLKGVNEIRVVNNSDGSNNVQNDTESDQVETPNMKVVNRFVFNNTWKVQFSEDRTVRDYFYSGRRETTRVWMMTIEAETFKFYEDLEMRYKFIELPYEVDHMSMILALPTQYDHPANLQVDTKTFCKIKSKLIPTKLDMVSIPKLQFSEEISFKEQLIELGIEDAFNGSNAQFPGLSDEENFHVDDVLQKIKFEVDEDGSEAASSTKLKFKPVAFRGVKEFIANHPFLFYVEDRKTGTILLSGRVDEPSESISLSEHLRF